MGAGLVMNSQHRCPGIPEALKVPVGFNNHKMHIKGLFGQLLHILHYRKAKRYIGNKHTIHYVKMKPVGPAAVNHYNVPVQPPEVSSQQ